MNQTRPPSLPSAGAHQRGFAIAMVVLLMVVVGLGVGMAMTRFSAQSKTVARSIEKYQDHHLGRGLQEAIGAWLRQQNGRELLDVLEPETGHAMDIVLADGSEVAVYLRDAQGAALSNLSGLTDRQIEEGGLILRNLSVNTTEPEFLRFTRPFGPATVSINTAPARVLDAASRVAAGEYADRFIAELEALQNQGTSITRTDLTRASTSAGLSSLQRAAALRIFSTDIELWAVIIEVRAGRGMNSGRLVSRYGGITRIRVNARNNSGNPMELGAFVTWKDIGIDDREVDLADLY
jgi:type II secretory pathway component PulK